MPFEPIVTRQLLLRPFTLADAPRVRELAGDFKVADTTGHMPHPYPEGAAEEWIRSQEEEYQATRATTFAITLRESGILIGAIAVHPSPQNKRAEMGYWLGVSYWGNGYCTEAAHAVLAYSFETLGLNRIYASYFPRNPASGRVMQKIGMRPEGTLRQHFVRWTEPEDLVYYGILKSEWLAQTAT